MKDLTEIGGLDLVFLRKAAKAANDTEAVALIDQELKKRQQKQVKQNDPQ